jgi:hypothetical protein
MLSLRSSFNPRAASPASPAPLPHSPAYAPSPHATAPSSSSVERDPESQPHQTHSGRESQDSCHIHISLVDKCLAIMWNLAPHIAQMDIRDFPLFAILVHRIVNVAFRHLRQRTNAQFQPLLALGTASIPVDTSPADKPVWLLPHRGHRRIVRMQCQPHSSLFRHRDNFGQKCSSLRHNSS